MTEKELDIITHVVALLNRHDYWKKELYRTRKATKKKYKHEDSAELENAFLSIQLMHAGVYTTPCGCGWYSTHNTKEEVEEYFSRYEDLFDDYWQWQLEQR